MRILQEDDTISGAIGNSFVDDDGNSSDSLSRMGYGSNLFIENIESSWVILVFMIISPVFNRYLLHYGHYCRCFDNCGQRYYHWINLKLYWNTFIRFFLEGVLSMMIAVFM